MTLAQKWQFDFNRRSKKLHHTFAQTVEIGEELDDDLPLVSMDEEQIKQVLLNLAINALQAMPEGGRLVFRSSQKDETLFLETEDTAGGIDETIKAKIFDPFFSTKDKGLGLGLAVVYKIVSRHDGRIKAFDTTGGTKFVLTLPLNSTLSD